MFEHPSLLKMLPCSETVVSGIAFGAVLISVFGKQIYNAKTLEVLSSFSFKVSSLVRSKTPVNTSRILQFFTYVNFFHMLKHFGFRRETGKAAPSLAEPHLELMDGSDMLLEAGVIRKGQLATFSPSCIAMHDDSAVGVGMPRWAHEERLSSGKYFLWNSAHVYTIFPSSGRESETEFNIMVICQSVMTATITINTALTSRSVVVVFR